tara:strand:+ start:715 stop:957 length:243 start_codon:yes stop_codon:yes gene_type:complete
VGIISGNSLELNAEDWNSRLMDFMAVVDDFNVRGQRDQISHPGFVSEYKFCTLCGERLDREALGLLTYSEAFDRYMDAKG